MGEECIGGETVTLIRLHIVVEGQTEEGFVNEVMAPELGALDIFIDAHSITTGRKKGRLSRGGWDSYGKLRRDLIRWMKEDRRPDAWFTTMVDLYGLPQDFPGYVECQRLPEARGRVECLEERLALDVRNEGAEDPAYQRLVPYVQLHEFESLLFSDPSKFEDAFPGRHAVIEELLAIRKEAGGPEAIDDGATTAPSRRILDLLPDYVKPVSGLLILKKIGLSVLRRECPHFDAWIAKLLALAATRS